MSDVKVKVGRIWSRFNAQESRVSPILWLELGRTRVVHRTWGAGAAESHFGKVRNGTRRKALFLSLFI